MSANIIDIYAAHGDGGERGIGPIIGYFSTEFGAIEAAKGKGFYGGNGGTSKHYAVVVDGKTFVLVRKDPVDVDGKQAKKDEELRKQTLASLTCEQRRVLGV